MLAPQNATVTAAASGPLIRATVRDAKGQPAPSVRVEFAAPHSGATCTLSSSFAIHGQQRRRQRDLHAELHERNVQRDGAAADRDSDGERDVHECIRPVPAPIGAALEKVEDRQSCLSGCWRRITKGPTGLSVLH